MQDTTIKNPHDGIFKTFLQNIEVARDFMEIHVPEKFKSKMNFSTLYLESGSFVTNLLRQSYSDILYSVKSKEGNHCYIYLLIEHQSTINQLMPFRLLRYSLEVMQQHLNQGRGTELPLVVPLVFYQGRADYNYGMNFIDCFTDTELAKELYSNPFHLIKLAKIQDQDILEHKRAALLELVQKHIKDEDMLGVADSLGNALHKVEIPHDLFQSLIKYVNECGNVSNGEEFLKVIAEKNPSYEGDVMQLMQPFIEQGIQQRDRQIVQNMVGLGYDYAKIKECTGLTDTALAQLTQSMNIMLEPTASGSTNVATASNQEFGLVAHVDRTAKNQ